MYEKQLKIQCVLEKISISDTTTKRKIGCRTNSYVFRDTRVEDSPAVRVDTIDFFTENYDPRTFFGPTLNAVTEPA